jgi:hypothetical protein
MSSRVGSISSPYFSIIAHNENLRAPTIPHCTSFDHSCLTYEWLPTFINGVVHRFLADIVTSIVLPHKFYKRIMNRILRKSTYQVIQQAVDISYKIEEDTINLADLLLDSFVEKEVRDIAVRGIKKEEGNKKKNKPGKGDSYNIGPEEYGQA